MLTKLLTKGERLNSEFGSGPSSPLPTIQNEAARLAEVKHRPVSVAITVVEAAQTLRNWLLEPANAHL